jgi:hypothetical protein
MEKLIFNKNGQWDLVKNNDDHDEFTSAYKNYQKPKNVKTYDVEMHKDFANTPGWTRKPGIGGDLPIQSHSDQLNTHPEGTENHKIEQNVKNNNWDITHPAVELRPVAGDAHSLQNLNTYNNLLNLNGFMQHGAKILPGYDAGGHTFDDSGSFPTYHVFHGNPKTGAFTHVGAYEMNPDEPLDEPQGETHPEHKHKEKALKNALLSMHLLRQAEADHQKSYEEVNPHLYAYSFSENPEQYDMHADSFKHFLKNGQALHFDKSTHQAYIDKHARGDEAAHVGDAGGRVLN